jgi:DNA-binding transcriptional LysR family regulator
MSVLWSAVSHQAQGVTQLNRFDLNLLVVFEAVYAERGISRAAERLNLTQSAVSHALGRMREHLGDPLFTRSGHDMQPTAYAGKLIEPIRRALAEIEGTMKTLDRFDAASSSRHFYIGVRGYTESVILPPLFRALRQQGPKLTLTTVRHNRASLAKLFNAGAIDLAVDILTTLPDEVSAEILGRSPLRVMLRAGHPALTRPLDFDVYVKLDHVVASTNRRGASLEDAALRIAGRSRRIALHCQNYASASAIVAESDLALTIPGIFSHRLADPALHRVVPGPFGELSFDIYMYWNSRADTDPAITWLRSVAREHIGRALGVD